MKIVKNIIMSLLCCIPTMFVTAQELTNAQERYMKLDVLYLMEDYSLYSNLVIEDDKEIFMSLFSDTTIQIYNDLLGISAEKTLSVGTYADKLITVGGGTSTIDVFNIGHDDIYYSDGLWYMDVTFSKKLTYLINCDIQFSSEEYFKADHRLRAVVSWNPDNRECKIVALDGAIESEVAMLPEEYWIFRFNNPNDTLVLYDGEPLKFDRFNQAFFPKDELLTGKLTNKQKKINTPLLLAQSHFTYPIDSDTDISLGYEDEDCNLLYLTYTPKRWRFRMQASMIPSNYYQVTTTYEGLNVTSSAMEGSLEFGYVKPSAKKNKTAFFFGLAVRQAELNASVDRLSYIYRTNVEVDNDTYYRAYYIDYLKYRMSMTELGIPLYFDSDIKFNNRLSMYIDYGVKAYATIMGPSTSYNGLYTTKGLYQQYDNLVFHSGSGAIASSNNFVTKRAIEGVINEERSFTSVDEAINSLHLSVDALAGVGFRLRLLKNTFLDLGCRYQYNLLSGIECSGEVNFRKANYNTELYKASTNSFSPASSVTPIQYKTEGVGSSKKRVEKVANLTNSFSSINNSALYFNAGIVIRY